MSHVDVAEKELQGWRTGRREAHTEGLTIVNPELSTMYQTPFQCFAYIISFNYLKAIISLHS